MPCAASGASGVLRSVYPLVLGLGGWCLGALTVMTIAPTVPLDDAVLVVLSVGTPIGLGVYGASVRREWSREDRTAGLVAGVAGALLGAWLAFDATTPPLAILTTIVGATAGANLLLIALDLVRGRSPSRDRQEGPDDRGHRTGGQATVSDGAAALSPANLGPER